MQTVFSNTQEYSYYNVKSGVYSLAKTPPQQSSINTIVNGSETEVTFEISLAHKAFNPYKTHIVFYFDQFTDVHILNAPPLSVGACANGYELLYLTHLSPITAYKLSTKLGQTIADHSWIRSFARTLPDRIKPYDPSIIDFPQRTTALDLNTVLEPLTGERTPPVNGDNVAMIYGSTEPGADARIAQKNVKVEGSTRVKILKTNVVTGAIGGYSTTDNTISIHGFFSGDLRDEKQNNKYEDDVFNSAILVRGSNNTLKQLKVSIRLSDILGGFWDLDKDILFPNESLIFTFKIDNKFLVVRHIENETTANSNTNPNFRLKDVRLNMYMQEDIEVNQKILAEIKSKGLNIPYEFVRLHTYPSTENNTQDFWIQRQLFNDAGSLIRRIFLCPSTKTAIKAGSSKLTQENHMFLNNLRFVKFYYNETLLGEYDMTVFDNIKNTKIKSWSNFMQFFNCYLCNYFCDPWSKDDELVSGIELNPSSQYRYEITTTDNTVYATGIVNYESHICSIKYMNITEVGTVVNPRPLPFSPPPTPQGAVIPLS